MSKTRKPLIVGIDPGLYVGISIVGVNGKIIELTTMRNPRKSTIIRYINKFGKPIIIASDVNPLPKLVKRLASCLGAVTFYPPVPLSNLEKTKIIKKYKRRLKDTHQKDSLAAALKAYKNYSELFHKIKEELKKIKRVEIFEMVVLKLFEKKGENIKDAIRKVLYEETIGKKKSD